MIITNLFSIFDPTIRVLSLNWMIGLLVLLFLPHIFWTENTTLRIAQLTYNTIKKEIDFVIKNPVKGLYRFIGAIFSTIVLYNFLALFPFIFSVTSHLLVTFPLSYTFWTAIIVFRWVSSLKHFLAHLIPVGTPVALIRFIVIVEILRNLIRPIALTFRLTANIMAGHLLISLIGGAIISLPFSAIVTRASIQSLLVIIELGVSVIQAYVFSNLLLLYISEGEH